MPSDIETIFAVARDFAEVREALASATSEEEVNAALDALVAVAAAAQRLDEAVGAAIANIVDINARAAISAIATILNIIITSHATTVDQFALSPLVAPRTRPPRRTRHR